MSIKSRISNIRGGNDLYWNPENYSRSSVRMQIKLRNELLRAISQLEQVEEEEMEQVEAYRRGEINKKEFLSHLEAIRENHLGQFMEHMSEIEGLWNTLNNRNWQGINAQEMANWKSQGSRGNSPAKNCEIVKDKLEEWGEKVNEIDKKIENASNSNQASLDEIATKAEKLFYEKLQEEEGLKEMLKFSKDYISGDSR